MSRFAPGARVRVRDDYPPGHVRTPVYLRGRCGLVERDFGVFGDPERLAYRLPDRPKSVYLVRFRAVDLWPDYAGPPGDLVAADIADHWLEPIP